MVTIALLGTACLTGNSVHAAEKESDAKDKRHEVANEANFDEMKLWLGEPSLRMDHTFALGNGRHGAVFGFDQGKEVVHLSETTLWALGPEKFNRKGACEHLPELWRLLDERKFLEANKLMGEFLAPMQSRRLEKMGELHLAFPGHETSANYRHELDLDAATRKITYTHDGATFTRRAILPVKDQVLAMEIDCDQPGKITFDAEFTRDIYRTFSYGEDGKKWNRQKGGPKIKKVELVAADFNAERLTPEGATDTLALRGTGDPPESGVRWEARLKAVATGGEVSVSGNVLRVKGADRVILLVAMETNFDFYKGVGRRDPAAECAKWLAAAEKRPFEAMLKEHVAEHRGYFRRCSLDLGESTPEQEALDTKARILRTRRTQEDDPDLGEQFFQMGRYLIIASARPGNQASTLYGVWPESYGKTGENCGYHMDINVTQHYGPSLLTGLADCHETLTDFAEALLPNARETAREVYNIDGAVMTLNPDGWLNTGMYGGVGYAMQWVGAYGWLSQHVWDHYDYTRDEDYLRRRAWPILTEALKFYMAYNRVNPETGKIQVGPSGSPENGFRHEGERVTTDYGVAIDQEIAWELSDHVLKAAKVLGIEDGFTARVREFQSKLALPAVNKEGRLLEWRDDREEVHPDHRHLSHLYGFQPGDRLSMLKTPELAAAVRKALERRLEGKPYGNIIWSKAWILCQWARLLDADKAFDQYLIGGLSRMCPNLVKPWTHVYCMDANGGFTFGMAEMFVQSHVDGIIHLFPAKPEQWAQGSFTGFHARDDVAIDAKWNAEGAEVTLTAARDGEYQVKLADRPVQTVTLKAGQPHDRHLHQRQRR